MGQWQCRKVSKGLETTDGESEKSKEQGAVSPLNPRETNEESKSRSMEAMVEGVKTP